MLEGKYRSVRIPKSSQKPVVNVYEIDEAINSYPEEEMNNLMRQNIMKWKQIRNDWRVASQQNKLRYKHSCNMLKVLII